ncbi:MAG: septum formation initiator family protein [Candidatus Paceibacterota bacterium]
MRTFPTKRNIWQKLTESKFFLLFLVLLFIFFFWRMIEFGIKLKNTEENRRVAEIKVDELKQKKENYLQKLSDLNTEKGIEEDIREKFSVAKEGEKVIVIVDEEKEVEGNTNDESFNIFSFFKKWFK